ncbi:hypothetical protein BZG36_00695 [Bifiguratus adelaidae]|uniref:Mediator of RNA polymerase II transcription subunit 16 n=1 Tax=Bifiguratus adelaidae TaxID=1938954 RepID=A0A261Y6X9_9FUNG|nr:hypothetical protein BZG36_00695 [Bifiguratus adelaidae]
MPGRKSTADHGEQVPKRQRIWDAASEYLQQKSIGRLMAWSSKGYLALCKQTTSSASSEASDRTGFRVIDMSDYYGQVKESSVVHIDTSTSMESRCDAQLKELHGHHDIVHVQWSQQGNFLATVDEVGRLGIWEIGETPRHLHLVFSRDAKQPIVSFLWFHAGRKYTMHTDASGNAEFTLERHIGPINPFGLLSFALLGADGELVVGYQHSQHIWDSFSRRLSKPVNVLSELCPISHADMMLHQDGTVVVAAYWSSCSSPPLVVYRVEVVFGARQKENVIHPRFSFGLPLSSLKASEDDPEFGLSNFMLCAREASMSLVTVTTSKAEAAGRSMLSVVKLPKDTNALSAIDSEYTPTIPNDLQIACDSLITCVSATSTGQLLVGFRDGHVELEKAPLQDDDAVHLVGGSNSHSTLGGQFLALSSSSPQHQNAVLGLVLSPNESLLASYHENNSVTSHDIAVTRQSFGSQGLGAIQHTITYCLLNQRTFDDLTPLVMSLFRSTKAGHDAVCEFLSQVASEYANILPNNVASSTELSDVPNFTASRNILGFCLGVFGQLGSEYRTEFTSTFSSLQLHQCFEALLSACTSDWTEVADVLNNTETSSKILQFDAGTAWTLIPVAIWLFEFCAWFLRHVVIFTNTRTLIQGQPQRYHGPSHLSLLLHKGTRNCMLWATLLVIKFTQFFPTLAEQGDQQAVDVAVNLLRQKEQECPFSIPEFCLLLREIGDLTDADLYSNYTSVGILLQSTLSDSALEKSKEVIGKHQSVFEDRRLFTTETLTVDVELHDKSVLQRVDIVRKTPLPVKAQVLLQAQKSRAEAWAELGLKRCHRTAANASLRSQPKKAQKHGIKPLRTFASAEENGNDL